MILLIVTLFELFWAGHLWLSVIRIIRIFTLEMPVRYYCFRLRVIIVSVSSYFCLSSLEDGLVSFGHTTWFRWNDNLVPFHLFCWHESHTWLHTIRDVIRILALEMEIDVIRLLLQRILLQKYQSCHAWILIIIYNTNLTNDCCSRTKIKSVIQCIYIHMCRSFERLFEFV